MTKFGKILAIWGVMIAVWLLEAAFINIVHPAVSPHIAVRQLDNSDASLAELRAFETLKNEADCVGFAIVLIASFVIITRPTKEEKES